MIRLADPLFWVAVALLATTVTLCVMLYTVTYGTKAKMQRRIRDVVGDVSGPLRSGDDETGGDFQSRRRMISGKLKELGAARQKKGRDTLRELIAQTGLTLSVGRFSAYSAVAAIVAATVAFAFGVPLLVTLCAAVIAGVGLPRLILVTLARRRIGKFTANFADAIDIITRGIRSGLPVGETFNIIIQEMPDPIGTEFSILVESQRLGLSLDEAMARICKRVPTAELRYFAIVLAIQQTTGGNLAETLAKLSEVLRARKRLRDKVRAMSGEARASATIIGALPFVVAALLAVVSPKYVAILVDEPVGHILLFVGIGLMGAGILVMRQMINFDV